jgi:hypothetical protein
MEKGEIAMREIEKLDAGLEYYFLDPEVAARKAMQQNYVRNSMRSLRPNRKNRFKRCVKS